MDPDGSKAFDAERRDRAARARAALMAALACASWGASFLAPRVLEDVPASGIAFARFLFFGAISAAGLLWRGKNLPRFTGEALREGLVLSVAGWSGYYALLATGIQLAGVPFATAIVGLLPMTILFAAVPAGDRRRFVLPGLLLGAGAILVPSELFTAEYGALLGRSFADRALGLGALVAALALWTFFAVRNARFLKRHPEWRALDWASVLGLAAGATSAAIFLAAGHEAEIPALLSDPRVLGWGAFLGIVGAWGATALWNRASRVLSAATVGQLLVLEAVFGLIYAFLYERRAPRIAEGGAVGCLLGGAALATRTLARLRDEAHGRGSQAI